MKAIRFRVSEQRQRGLASWIGAGVGFAVGVPLTRTISTAARPGQLPGFASVNGFSPHGYMARFAVLILATLAGAVLAVQVARFLRTRTFRQKHDARMAREKREPNRKLSFWRSQLLLPFVGAHSLTVWLFLEGTRIGASVSPLLLLAASLLGSVALTALLGRGSIQRGVPFLSAAALVLPVAFWQGRTAGVNAICAAAALLLPLAATFFEGSRRRRWMTGLGVVVLLPGSITAFAAAASPPRVADIFEDGHASLPASEYLRGELPFRDIVPGHGLFSDGIIQVAQAKLFGDDYRGLYRGDRALGLVFWPSVYALGYAATCSPGIAFAGAALTYTSWPYYLHQRSLPCFWIIALAVLASRTARKRLWIATGFAIPIALCWAVEFAAYGAAAAMIALWIGRGPRLRHLAALVLGAALSGTLIALLFIHLGIAADFANTTFRFLPTLLPVWALPLVRPGLPHPLTLGGIWSHLSDRTMFLYLTVSVALVAVAAAVARAPVVGARGRQTIPLFAFLVAAMLSVIERRHINYPYFLVPLALLLGIRWLAGRRPGITARSVAATALLILVLCVWRPWSLLPSVASARKIDAQPSALTELTTPRRARGALFTASDATLVGATAEFLKAAGLSEHDTWLDFANAPGLYYLFNRDCPVRYYQVSYYESADAQREVVAAIDRNPRVRAVLIASGLPSEPLDGVVNARRAPEVAKYIGEKFHPYFQREGVVFWLRN